MNSKSGSRWSAAALVTALLTAFVGGWAVASTQVATEINTGLLRAFHSVGQNLFGSAVFGVEFPPNPVTPETPVQMFFADSPAIPVEINVFYPPNPIYPPNPCRVYARLVISREGTTLYVDPSVNTTRLSGDEFSSIGVRPPVSGCDTPTEY